MAETDSKASKFIEEYIEIERERRRLDRRLALLNLPETFEIVDSSYYVGATYEVVKSWDFDKMRSFLPKEEFDKLLAPSPDNFDKLSPIYRQNINRFVVEKRGERKMLFRELGDEMDLIIPLKRACFFDIETDGIPAKVVTMVGMYFPDEKAFTCPILPTGARIKEVLDFFKTEYIVTYNGDAFDIPVVRDLLGLDLANDYKSFDIMPICHHHGIKGGLKFTEKYFGIRRSEESATANPVALWEKFAATKDNEYLKTLTNYNRDDVLNMFAIAKKLNVLTAKE